MAKEIRLDALEKTEWVIFGLLAAGSIVFLDWKITLGVIAGGLIVILNFKVLRRIVEKGFSSEKGVSKSFFFKYTLKFLTLIAAVAGIAFLLQGVINLVAFLVGLLTIFLAIFVEGLRGYRYINEEKEKTNGT
jgi:hypothetical protein